MCCWGGFSNIFLQPWTPKINLLTLQCIYIYITVTLLLSVYCRLFHISVLFWVFYLFIYLNYYSTLFVSLALFVLLSY